MSLFGKRKGLRRWMASLNVDTGIPGYLRTIRKGTQDHPRLSASGGRKTSVPQADV